VEIQTSVAVAAEVAERAAVGETQL
jgi:hypothetical protein